MIRKIHFLVAAIASLVLSYQSRPAQAQNYNLTSLFSANGALSGFPAVSPSINNFGEVAYARRVSQPSPNPPDWVIFIHDGNAETEFFNITDVFGNAGVNANVVINDNGAVAVKLDFASSTSPCPNITCVVRINPDKSVTVLATAAGGGTADFVEFEQWISFNNAGQVAIKVRNND